MKNAVTGILRRRSEIAGSWLRLDIHAPMIVEDAEPGHFVQVRPAGIQTPLLRRPFSIAATTPEGVFTLLIKVCGEMTAMLATLNPGHNIEIIGPLGLPFTLPRASEHVALVAGGIGAAPMCFTAKMAPAGSCVLLFGSRSSDETAILSDPSFDGVTCLPATEDGSHGYHGYVTGLLEDYISATRRPDRILVCGPAPMMKAAAAIAAAHSIPCEVSLETYMSCALGLCMGCAVPAHPSTGKSYFHACTDGPVFDSTLIDWEAI